MPITIGSNIASLNAQRQLSRASDGLSSIFERLSSGQRINKASDDAAGLAISSTLRTDTRVFTQGIRNLNDGISLLSIAEGALNQLSGITQRQLELATQAANGTYSTKQRKALQLENAALINEFNRLIESSSFNGIKLLDGTLRTGLGLQAGAGANTVITTSVGTQLSRTVGNGTFSSVTSLSMGTGGQYDTISADINNDGKLDIIAASWGSGGFSVRLGVGDGTFQTAVTRTGTAQTTTVRAIDINGDGNLDILTGSQSGQISVYMGTGQGTFGAATSYTSAGGLVFGADAADFNSDGLVDFVGVDSVSGAMLLFAGNGDGTFRSGTTIATVGFNYSITSGDFNGDGRTDIAYSGLNTSGFLIQKSDGTFDKTSFTESTTSYDIKTADLDGDGNLDLISTLGGTGSLLVRMGNGNGTFKNTMSYNVGFNSASAIQYQDLTITDINGDGAGDVLIVQRDGVAGASVQTLINNGDGTFQAARSLGAVGDSLSGTAGDFNGDGVTDVIAMQSWGELGYYQGNTTVSTKIARTDISSQSQARSYIEALTNQLQRITQELGSIGAFSSRISTASNVLTATREAYQGAMSRISDSDTAEDAAQLVRLGILQQAGASVLAQTNQQPALVLQLLRG